MKKQFLLILLLSFVVGAGVFFLKKQQAIPRMGGDSHSVVTPENKQISKDDFQSSDSQYPLNEKKQHLPSPGDKAKESIDYPHYKQLPDDLKDDVVMPTGEENDTSFSDQLEQVEQEHSYAKDPQDLQKKSDDIKKVYEEHGMNIEYQKKD